MAMTFYVDVPAGTEVVLSLLLVFALAYVVRKCIDMGKMDHSDLVCMDYEDSLPPLGGRPFTGPELAHHNTQEMIKKQIKNMEKSRQAAFEELCKIHARRGKIEKTLGNLTEILKRDYPTPRGPADEFAKRMELEKRIRHLSKEREECFGIMDSICHRMYMMLIQRLALRRKIDRLDLQMESARLADILYPWNVASDGLWDQTEEQKDQ
ncbi:hypothetical protein FANTH_3783 [Fusarium anthophilum]|uniref:Uncharacterized protein n=1 Tax=Fusarium anthophilum TaxID=48485 RepID=A0A8H4ZQP1_9HYPO|nr:hypothetical protein FANTH_3783 [Fusarium anthophilum]